MSNRAKPARGISAKLVEYFLKHSDQQVYLHDIAQAIGFAEPIVQSNINALRGRRVGGADNCLETIVQGRIWIWHSKTNTHDGKLNPPAKRMFEEIGPARDGTLVIQDTNGTLYRAQEL